MLAMGAIGEDQTMQTRIQHRGAGLNLVRVAGD
jgi:hypothetical protein